VVISMVTDDAALGAITRGPDGIIAGRHIGPIDETTLINGIETLRAKARP